jgi:acyl dehydratase
MTNSSSVDFTINASATVAGAFLASATSGTTGTLYGIVDFTAARSVLSGDTLQITVTVTAS